MLVMLDGLENNLSLEIVRDGIHSDIHSESPETFPYGAQGTDLYDLVKILVNGDKVNGTIITCSMCCTQVHEPFHCLSSFVRLSLLGVATGEEKLSVEQLLKLQLHNVHSCHHCNMIAPVYEEASPSIPSDVMLIPIPQNAVLNINR